jgi:cytochrome b involved in lipid metabolism
VTEYLRRHPGGEEVMLEYVGYDATMAFRGVGHSPAAMRTMNKFLIGILPKHERLGFSAE